MNSLVEIAKKYSTTKHSTGFLEIYENYFNDYKDNEIKILEIGVDKGSSLRLWREYFSKAIICGLDIDKKDFIINQSGFRFSSISIVYTSPTLIGYGLGNWKNGDI